MTHTAFKRWVAAWWVCAVLIIYFGYQIKAHAQNAGYIVPSTMASAAINISTATTTKVITGIAGRWTYITSFNVIAGGSGNFQLVYGTGSNCGTGQTNLTGAYNLTAQAGLVVGSGIAPALVIPIANDVCVITSAAVQMSGSIAYAQP